MTQRNVCSFVSGLLLTLVNESRDSGESNV